MRPEASAGAFTSRRPSPQVKSKRAVSSTRHAATAFAGLRLRDYIELAEQAVDGTAGNRLAGPEDRDQPVTPVATPLRRGWSPTILMRVSQTDRK